jgi:ankyrin repeat protein
MKNNCLYWTIVSGNLALFTYLLDQGAEYENLNGNKENLLHVTCMLGHSQYIHTLMTRCNLDVTAFCCGKRTPLERVAENGDVASLKELIKCGVLLTSCVLPYAAANGRLPFIK